MSQEKCEEEDYSQEECVYVPVSVVDGFIELTEADIDRLERRKKFIEGIRYKATVR